MLSAVAAAVIIAIVWLMQRFDPSLREQREFEAKLRERQPLNDEKFAVKIGNNDTVNDAASRVRKLFAKHTGYPGDRLLADDDLAFFWAELDGNDLIKDLEREFSLAISVQEAEVTRCTIRAVTLLIMRKLAATD